MQRLLFLIVGVAVLLSAVLVLEVKSLKNENVALQMEVSICQSRAADKKYVSSARRPLLQFRSVSFSDRHNKPVFHSTSE